MRATFTLCVVMLVERKAPFGIRGSLCWALLSRPALPALLWGTSSRHGSKLGQAAAARQVGSEHGLEAVLKLIWTPRPRHGGGGSENAELAT